MARRTLLTLALALALALVALVAVTAEAARPLRNHSGSRKLKTFGLLDSIVSTTVGNGGYYSNNRYNNDDDSYFYPNTATYYPSRSYGWGGYTGGYVPRPAYSYGYGRPYAGGWTNSYGGWGGRPYRGYGYGK